VIAGHFPPRLHVHTVTQQKEKRPMRRWLMPLIAAVLTSALVEEAAMGAVTPGA
jgi:hypothetical protein